ncbi:MAG: substrate-binding and VWA domain-containing protein [Actinomycetota bacterium]|nr:substrate-binding and VWA domain-containing protein [Actinomycetota bacterium]
MDQPPRSRVPLFVATVVGIVLILVVRSLLNDGGSGDNNSRTVGPDNGNTGSCVRIVIAASSEKAALLKQMAAEYERRGATVDGRCVRVSVESKASGGAAEALARGWNETVDGPRPDVWSPAASSWVVILRQRLAEQDAPNIVPEDLPRIATTPLVIAMPRPMAQAMGWPNRQLGWADILSLAQDPAGWGKFGHPEWGRFRLGKTNPNFSTSGLHATIASFFAATGRSSDLTEADTRDPKVVAFVKGVESSVVHYGDITLTFLENLQKADDRGQGLSYISAVTVEEKSVWDYNMGNPSGDPSTLGSHPRPRTPLAAVYPKEGTLLSDNPFVVLNAAWVDQAKKRAAQGFLRFLQQPPQQQRFQQAAFRDFRGRPGRHIHVGNGLLPNQPSTVLSPPPPRVLDRVERSWDRLRKRARVLLVIDVSGSMGDLAAESGESKLDLAKRAAIRSLTQFAPDDGLGLWIFSSEFPPNGQPYLELVPISSVRERLDELRTRISSLTPQGGTALYATTRAATRYLRSSFDPERINAVVLLTDGKNEYPPDNNLESLVRELSSEGEEVAVRVFPIAYGGDADLPTLRRIAEASRAAAYDAADPASIDKVFTAVVSNF